MDETKTPTTTRPLDPATAWYAEVEVEASRELGSGAVLKDLATDETWEWLREELTPAEAVTWVLADAAGGDYDEPVTCGICDGVHGTLCPVESPEPWYYADELAAGR